MKRNRPILVTTSHREDEIAHTVCKAENDPSRMAPKRKTRETKQDQEPAAETVEVETKEKPADKPSTKKSKSGGKLAVGDNVSAIEAVLTTEEEKEVTLTSLCEDQGVIIFMYPKANTGGCTKQACGFKDNYDTLKKEGYDVYGMSFDKPKSQTNWKNKYSLPYHLLTDGDGTVLKAFGAFKLPRNVIRSHVIIEKNGKVLDMKNQISPGDSFAEAVKFVKALKP